MTNVNLVNRLIEAIEGRTATVGVCGLGYVGLPLAAAAAEVGFSVIGFDIDTTKVEKVSGGRSYIDAVSSERLSALVGQSRLSATSDFLELARCDVVILCVPTPLSRQREPNLSFIRRTASDIAHALRPGQLVVLESTSYPGTTDGVLKPILESGGLVSGKDFFVGFSPEREDPGNTQFRTTTIPKVVAGDGPDAHRLVAAFYSAFVEKIVPVSTNSVAEAVKITENVFRAVNIALVNELKLIYDAMGIDVWEVIEAARTKPFGFMPFYPGPGLGGHCIPIDPFYLTWKSREFQLSTRFIELAGEINISMPAHVVGKLEQALDRVLRKSLGTSRILILGLAYKKNVSDIRESPSFRLIELLEARGAHVDFHDPFVSQVPSTREHTHLTGRSGVLIEPEILSRYDAALVATDHDGVDYGLVADQVPVVIDTRNVYGRLGLHCPNVYKA